MVERVVPKRPSHPLEVMRKRELAKLLKVSPWTIDNWRRDDPQFPPPIWMTLTTPVWRVVDIERWLATRQRGGLSPSWQQRGKKREAADVQD